MTTITEYATAYGAAAGLAGLISGIYVIGGLMPRLYAGGSAPALAIAFGPYAGGMVFDHFDANGCFIMAITAAFLMFVCITLTDLKGIDSHGHTEDTKGKTVKAKALNRFLEVKVIPI